MIDMHSLISILKKTKNTIHFDIYEAREESAEDMLSLPVELAPDALEAAFGRMASKNTAVIVEPEQVASWDHRKLGGAY